jgi:glycosyltransferase involved in cell wall biosynthesis
MIRRPLTIGMPISSFLPAVGGMEVGLHNIASRLAASRHRPIVFAPAGNVRALRKQNCSLPYQVVSFPPKLITLVEYAPRLALFVFDAFFAWARRRYKVDVWHGTMGYPIGVALAHFGRGGALPALVRCAGQDIQVDRSIGYGMRLDPMVDRLVRRWLPELPILVAITESVAEEYRALNVPDQKIESIPNGVNVARFRSASSRETTRRLFGIPEQDFVFLSIGRNHTKKNHAAVLEAAGKLASCHPNSKWAVVIVGKNAPDLRAAAMANGIAERVYLIDEIGQGDDLELPNRKLVDLYRCADAFVFPSLIETFGIAIVEAMAAGLPVVTADAPGCRDIVGNGKYGLMVDPRDPCALAGAMERLLTDPVEYWRLAALSTERAQEFDWDHVVARYQELYLRLAACAEPRRDDRRPLAAG